MYIRFLQSIKQSSSYRIHNSRSLSTATTNINAVGNDIKTSIHNIINGKCQEGSTIQVKGWIRAVRKQKKFSFLQISDGSDARYIQAVLPSKELPDTLRNGSSISLIGNVVKLKPKNKKKDDNQKDQDIKSFFTKNGVSINEDCYELFCEKGANLNIIGDCDSESYPLQNKWHSAEFLRSKEILPLRSRSKRFGSILRIRSRANLELHNYFDSQGFINIHTPIISSIDCEGAGEMFKVNDPFVKDTYRYLTVSGQLHAEMFALSHSKVYTFNPAFRAENSNTSRHLNEFYMIEPEMSFCDLNESMDLAEGCIKQVINNVISKNWADLSLLFEQNIENKQNLNNDGEEKIQDIIKAKEKKFIRMTYDEALKILENNKDKISLPIEWGMPLQSEHERFITENWCDRTPVFITNYPAKCKPFYMKEILETNDDDDRKLVACFDLIIPRLGELIGGSEREDNLDLLKSNIEKRKINLKGELDWYIDLRKYGSAPHAGWGMGFERLVLFLTGVDNIRDVIPIPRVPGSFEY